MLGPFHNGGWQRVIFKAQKLPNACAAVMCSPRPCWGADMSAFSLRHASMDARHLGWNISRPIRGAISPHRWPGTPQGLSCHSIQAKEVGQDNHFPSFSIPARSYPATSAAAVSGESASRIAFARPRRVADDLPQGIVALPRALELVESHPDPGFANGCLVQNFIGFGRCPHWQVRQCAGRNCYLYRGAGRNFQFTT
jgi:hypothetical protein